MKYFFSLKSFFKTLVFTTLLFAAFCLEFCKKENSQPLEKSVTAIDRDVEVEEEYQYFIDGSEVSISTYQGGILHIFDIL